MHPHFSLIRCIDGKHRLCTKNEDPVILIYSRRVPPDRPYELFCGSLVELSNETSESYAALTGDKEELHAELGEEDPQLGHLRRLDISHLYQASDSAGTGLYRTKPRYLSQIGPNPLLISLLNTLIPTLELSGRVFDVSLRDNLSKPSGRWG